MPFDWNSLGAPPGADDVEVSVFGPGFGECIVVHVGGGRWLVVDSCVDATELGEPLSVAERYLRFLGVPIETAVERIVATHWHDDHVRGLAGLLMACRSAGFTCAQALLKSEFATFVYAMSTGSTATNGAKVKEFKRVLEVLSDRRASPIRFATGSKVLQSWTAVDLRHSSNCRLVSLSPSDMEYALFLESLGTMTPSMHQPKRAAARQTPNLNSVVLGLEFDSFGLLFGADMELHTSPHRGWNSAITEAATSRLRAASSYKVAHHGSANGDHEGIWTTLLAPRPVCIVTPFNRLPDSRKLPTDADVARLRARGRVLLAGPRNLRRTKSRDPTVIRSLREQRIEIRDLRCPLGMVRIRRAVAPGAEWRVESFGVAQDLAAEP